MGSAIGDYIHLNVQNYLNFGTVKKSSHKKELSLAEVYRQQKQINYQRINSIPTVKNSVLTELSKRVSKNFPEGKDRAKESLNKAIAEQKLSEQFKDFILNNVSGKITRSAHITKNTISKMSTDNEMVKIKEAQRIRNNLYQNIKTLNNRFEKGLPAGTTPETIAKNFTEYFKALGMSMPDGGYVIKPTDIYNMDTLTALRSLLQEISFAQASKATLHGQMGEQTVAMCGDVITKKALESVNGIVVGSHPSSFQLNESIIPKTVGQTFLKDTGLNLYRVYSTQDKVDVQIIVNKQPLNVSVKAYSAKGNTIRAHLQDISLLTSLATTVSNFANHWLNIHSLNLKSSLLDSVLKEHVKYEALVSGNLLKQGASLADTFVSIDVNTGRVYSASTKDILNEKSSSYFILNPLIENIKINGNTFAATWEQRISNILQSVHAIKIKTSLNIGLKSI